MKNIARLLAALLFTLSFVHITEATLWQAKPGARQRPQPKPAPASSQETKKANTETKTETMRGNTEFLFWLLNKQARKSVGFTHDQDKFACSLNDKSQIEISINRDTTQTDPEGGIFETKYTFNPSDLQVLYTWYYKSKERVNMKLSVEEGIQYGVTRGASINDALMKKYPGLKTRNGPIPVSEIPPGCFSLEQAIKQIVNQYQDSRSQYEQEKKQLANSKSQMTEAERRLVLPANERKEYIDFIAITIFENRLGRKFSFVKNNSEKFDVESSNPYGAPAIEITVNWTLPSGPGMGTYLSRFYIYFSGKVGDSSYRHNDNVERTQGIVRPSIALKNPGDYISPDAALKICADYFGYVPGVRLDEQPVALKKKEDAKNAAEAIKLHRELERNKAERARTNRRKNVDFLFTLMEARFPLSERSGRLNDAMSNKAVVEFDIDDYHYVMKYDQRYSLNGIQIIVTQKSSNDREAAFRFSRNQAFIRTHLNYPGTVGTNLNEETDVDNSKEELVQALSFEPAKFDGVHAYKDIWEKYKKRNANIEEKPSQVNLTESKEKTPTAPENLKSLRQRNIDFFFFVLNEKVPDKGPGVVEKKSSGEVRINIGRIPIKRSPSAFEFPVGKNKYKLTRKDQRTMEILITDEAGSSRKYLYSDEQVFQRAEFKVGGQNIAFDREADLISRKLDKEEMEFDAQQFAASKELRELWERYQREKGIK